MKVSGQLHASAALTPGKEPRYPFDRRLGGTQSRSSSCGVEEISFPAGNRTPAVQTIARRYADWARRWWVTADTYRRVGKRCLILYRLVTLLLLLLLLCFHIDYQNVRSLRIKQLEVYENAHSADYNTICLPETWLSDLQFDHNLLPDAQFSLLTGCLQIRYIAVEYLLPYPTEFAPVNTGKIQNIATDLYGWNPYIWWSKSAHWKSLFSPWYYPWSFC
jgi:hypothetical protein